MYQIDKVFSLFDTYIQIEGCRMLIFGGNADAVNRDELLLNLELFFFISLYKFGW